MEKKREIKTYLVELYCDVCGNKMMLCYAEWESEKPYVYKCVECGYKMHSDKEYPFRMEQKTIGELGLNVKI